MKLAISTRGQDVNAPVDLHFGRTRFFRIVDFETGAETLLNNARAANAPQGAGIQTAQTLARLGVQAVLTGGVGPNAWRILQAARIQVFSVRGGSVGQALQSFREGLLRPLTEKQVTYF
ncbi:MAG: NifB/NifX family molybdenum-iron cluster-binding protein [Verrucomicrobia bacterium]|nr:NifB/NifX family molybdenum-iron cluster-binding protein [Verrucomicrobiota bacterium]